MTETRTPNLLLENGEFSKDRHRRVSEKTENENGEPILKQDGRLAPAFFSTNYKYFDQLLQTVKTKLLF